MFPLDGPVSGMDLGLPERGANHSVLYSTEMPPNARFSL